MKLKNSLLTKYNTNGFFKPAVLALWLVVFIVFSSSLAAQEFKPEIAEFGDEEAKPKTPSPAIKPLIIDQEVSLDSVFQLSVQQISRFYQSASMIFRLKNTSELYVNHIWFQVRLLDKNGGFLHREQPVLFTEINIGQGIRYELIFESIEPEQIGYMVFRPELVEVENKEYPLNESYFSLSNETAFDIYIVFNTRF